MGYQEVDQNLCKQCFIKLKRPSKKTIKNMILTTYEDRCENCGKTGRVVEYTWDKEEEGEEQTHGAR